MNNELISMNKIELLKKVKAGELLPIDLLSGDDSFFVKIGRYYVRDGVRYSEKQFRALDKSFKRKKISVQIICLSNTEAIQSFFNANTQPA